MERMPRKKEGYDDYQTNAQTELDNQVILSADSADFRSLFFEIPISSSSLEKIWIESLD